MSVTRQKRQGCSAEALPAVSFQPERFSLQVLKVPGRPDTHLDIFYKKKLWQHVVNQHKIRKPAGVPVPSPVSVTPARPGSEGRRGPAPRHPKAGQSQGRRQQREPWKSGEGRSRKGAGSAPRTQSGCRRMKLAEDSHSFCVRISTLCVFTGRWVRLRCRWAGKHAELRQEVIPGEETRIFPKG